MVIVGEVDEFPKEFHIEWKIPDFFSLWKKDCKEYSSTSFHFADRPWYLEISLKDGDFGGFISIFLHLETSSPPVNLKFSLSLKTVDGKKAGETHCSYTFDESDGYGIPRYFSRSELLERKSELIPDDALTVLCTLKSEESADNEKLSQDFKKMMLDGLSHDLILKTGDKEFRAHRDILRARSRVFESMLTHDMKEKTSGVIDVPDCDSQAMELFLSYVYCGKVETLDESNMLGLYYIADKYEMESLKEVSCNFMKISLSPTNICEVIQLARKHSDSTLLEYATEYFINNAEDIMSTVEWQLFLKDNVIVENELLLKTIKKLKK